MCFKDVRYGCAVYQIFFAYPKLLKYILVRATMHDAMMVAPRFYLLTENTTMWHIDLSCFHDAA